MNDVPEKKDPNALPLLIDPAYREEEWDPEEMAEEYFKRTRRAPAFSKRGLWFVSKVKRGPGKGRMRAKGRRTLKITYTEEYGSPLKKFFTEWVEAVVWEPKDVQS